MMIPDNVYYRITDFYYRVTAKEELINLIDDTLLQAIWDSEESIEEDELTNLAFEIIKEHIGLSDG